MSDNNDTPAKGLLMYETFLIPTEQIEKISLEFENARKNKEDDKEVKVNVEVEALHIGKPNKNFLIYEHHMIENTQDAWLIPYAKPVLWAHNGEGEPLGRVVSTRVSQCIHGGTALFLGLQLDETAYAKVMSGKYITTSVGFMATDARCSICQTNVVHDFCEHSRGEYYDGKQALWHIQAWDPIELSFVNVPADPQAVVVLTNSLAAENTSAEQTEMAEDIKEDDIIDVIEMTNAIEQNHEALANAKELDGMDSGEAITNAEEEIKIDTRGRTIFAHRLLHMWWNYPEKTTWPQSIVAKWHDRVVNALINQHEGSHNIVDGLDDSLPLELKNKSQRKKVRNTLTVQNVHLKRQVEALEAQVVTMTTELEELKKEPEVKPELEELQSKLAAIETENAELKKANAILEEGNMELTKVNAELEEEVNGAADHVSDVEVTLERVRNEVELLRTENQAYLTQAHKALAEVAYTFAASLGEAGERNEAITSYLSEDPNVLQNRVEDMRSRFLQNLMQVKVEDPTLPVEDTDGTTLVNNEPVATKEESVTQEALIKEMRKLFKSKQRL